MTDTRCPRCHLRTSPPDGCKAEDLTCGFPGNDFSSGNWNCATLNALRHLCAREPVGVNRVWHDDSTFATVACADAMERLDAVGHNFPCSLPTVLFVTWYKSRGNTGNVLAVSSSEARPATLAEVEAVLAHYGEGGDHD